MYPSRILFNQGFIQRSRTESGTYRCLFCAEKEYQYYSSLTKHKNQCKMNPDKKRKTSPVRVDADDDDIDEMVLHQKSANRGYKNIMATDCTDPDLIKGIFAQMEPLAIGLLRQRFVEEETQFNLDKEEFERRVRENVKVKLVLQSFNEKSGGSAKSSASTTNGAAGGGGSGIMGYFSSAKK